MKRRIGHVTHTRGKRLLDRFGFFRPRSCSLRVQSRSAASGSPVELGTCRAPNAGRCSLLDGLDVLRGIVDRFALLVDHTGGPLFLNREILLEASAGYASRME
jgi:hypothetical protein